MRGRKEQRTKQPESNNMALVSPYLSMMILNGNTENRARAGVVGRSGGTRRRRPSKATVMIVRTLSWEQWGAMEDYGVMEGHCQLCDLDGSLSLLVVVSPLDRGLRYTCISGCFKL